MNDATKLQQLSHVLMKAQRKTLKCVIQAYFAWINKHFVDRNNVGTYGIVWLFDQSTLKEPTACYKPGDLDLQDAGPKLYDLLVKWALDQEDEFRLTPEEFACHRLTRDMIDLRGNHFLVVKYTYDRILVGTVVFFRKHHIVGVLHTLLEASKPAFASALKYALEHQPQEQPEPEKKPNKPDPADWWKN